MWLKTATSLSIIVFAISLLLLGLMLDEVNAKELSTQLPAISGVQGSSLSAMINNALLGNVNSNSHDSTITGKEGEEYQVIHSYQNSHSQLSAMINNALLGNVNSNSHDSTASQYVMQQFITINPDGYNDNIIFEEPKKKVELLNSNIPFLLPVPFP